MSRPGSVTAPVTRRHDGRLPPRRRRTVDHPLAAPIAVRTLRDGRRSRLLPLPTSSDGPVTPLAWSPDQSRLAVYISDSSVGVLSAPHRLVHNDAAALSDRPGLHAADPGRGRVPVRRHARRPARPAGLHRTGPSSVDSWGMEPELLPAPGRSAPRRQGRFHPRRQVPRRRLGRGCDSRITFVSATESAPAEGVIHLYAVTTVRLIGWWADRALVVAFRPEPVTDIGPDGDEQAYAPTDYGLVRRLSILAVTPSSSPSQPPRSQT